jgi:hypothetical protein
LARGSSNRQTGATDMNSKSSRSHAIFSVTLAQQKFVPSSGSSGSSPSPQPINDPQQKSGVRPPSRSNSRLSRRFDEGEWVSITSKFHFVDLAGSERVSKKKKSWIIFAFLFILFFLFLLSFIFI